MPDKTPEQWLDDIKGGGLLVVRGGTFFFIPEEEFTKCKLPNEFQKSFPTISGEYFEKINEIPGRQLNEAGKIYASIEEVVSNFSRTDGIKQAVWIVGPEPIDNPALSKTEEGDEVLFKYSSEGNKNKIVVDMSKGGKVSK
jgi:hypothetical protein